ncbi:ABC transporter ATP-binding protein [Nocardioides sp. GXQ0305]|uniref:ABC transporter ATP-binding protein n=1 Tax=Nocardioides sp. GXQ0305 TaxID=3423912 RepID=UPI003D7C5083
MTTTPTPAIEIAGLTKTFRARDGEDVHAVRGLDLTIRTGEVVALLGPNGAGKTTTLDIVLGLTAPTGGTARVYGADPREAVVAGRVSAVLQTGGLLRDLTVRETADLVAGLHPDARPVDEVLDRAGISDIGGRMVAKCSGGEQQRLRFALALLPDPDLLVLDEPTAGMDVTARREFWATMHADADAGRTVVFATHYLEEADAFADRIVLMAQGRTVADGPTAEIRARATGRTVSATLPAAHHDATVARLHARADVAEVEQLADRVRVRCTDSDAVALALLTELHGSELEITTGSLESAFLAITAAAETTSHPPTTRPEPETEAAR